VRANQRAMRGATPSTSSLKKVLDGEALLCYADTASTAIFLKNSPRWFGAFLIDTVRFSFIPSEMKA